MRPLQLTLPPQSDQGNAMRRCCSSRSDYGGRAPVVFTFVSEQKNPAAMERRGGFEPPLPDWITECAPTLPARLCGRNAASRLRQQDRRSLG
jgi:hypothetical protein